MGASRRVTLEADIKLHSPTAMKLTAFPIVGRWKLLPSLGPAIMVIVAMGTEA
jgi:hypothetical protein